MSVPTPLAAPPLPALGKISPEIFTRVIAPHLGAARAEVLAGPRAGHDAAVIRIGAGRVMAVTTDPLSVIPALGPGALGAARLPPDRVRPVDDRASRPRTRAWTSTCRRISATTPSRSTGAR